MGQLDRFQLIQRIGVGGMGEIYLAEVLTGAYEGGRVAIKCMLPEASNDPVFVGMFLDEARLVTRLQCDQLCRVYERGFADGRYYLAMEYVEGTTLRQLLSRHKDGLSPRISAYILAEIGRGLDYAHRFRDMAGIPEGIVHRDVNPSNIMVGADGAVKLIDFGLAKSRTQLQKTLPGLVKGKFGYLAPEQLSGTIDHRTDIFAMGLNLYECLTGRRVFHQTNPAEVVFAVAEFSEINSLSAQRSDVPAELDAVCRRLLARNPEDRFQSAAEVTSILEKLLYSWGATTASVRAELAAAVDPEAGADLSSADWRVEPATEAVELSTDEHPSDTSLDTCDIEASPERRGLRNRTIIWTALILMLCAAAIASWSRSG
ncbi:MAG: serine/threonine-protein kinase [Myxococcota bacterium]